ncbi:aromatic ring-hydroxylating dioxygenase subunit alpha [Frankia sp. CcI49]|uniref:aromatic ring-hydroxylating oxygenase subunit alpha n=1 Tax=Frankia sp. CcI49 TaxID=1745382 RepID=UPI0013046DB5|nr:aromatic ring-hydroxylating dioxygenase subunit alpha [Frankia sp. CcI49]
MTILSPTPAGTPTPAGGAAPTGGAVLSGGLPEVADGRDPDAGLLTTAQREEYDAAWLAAARRSWHPVARGQDVPVGRPVPVTLLGSELVLWRRADGQLGLLAGSCIHRGTRLADGTVTAAGDLRCPYHGWEFRADGSCVLVPQLGSDPVPARIRQPAAQVDEHAGLVWACLAPPGEEATARPNLPEADLHGFRRHIGAPIRWRAQASRHIENFCDIAHFSILHTSSFGNPDVLGVDRYGVRRTETGQLLLRYDYPGRDYLAGTAGQVGPEMLITLDYEVQLPFTVTLREINGPGTLVFTALCPVDATSCVVFWLSARTDGVELDGPRVERAESEILEEDRLIVECQRPARMPLARGGEAHLRFDRFSVAYRESLAALGYPDLPPTR